MAARECAACKRQEVKVLVAQHDARWIRRVAALLLFLAQWCAAHEITLAWQPSTSSNVTYRIYQGPSPGFYTNAVDCGICTQATITNAVAMSYYVVSAVGADGRESVPSNEVCDCPQVVVMVEAATEINGPWTAMWSTNESTLTNAQRFYRISVRR